MKTNSLSLRSSALLGATVVGALFGCNEVVDSDVIRTQGMYAGITATTDATGLTRVDVTLRVAGPNGPDVNLIGDDKLTASLEGGSAKVLSGDDGDYSTTFNKVEGGDELQVSFERGEDDISAPDSFITIAEPFELELDDDLETIVRGNGIPLIWDPAGNGGTMEWKLDGDCVFVSRGTTADDGRLTIPADEVDPLSADEDCDITVTLRRVNEGVVDPTFEEGGEFLSIQQRTVEFFSKKAGSEEPGGGGEEDAPDGGSDGDDGDVEAPSEEGDAGDPSDSDAGTDAPGVADASAADSGDQPVPSVDAGAADSVDSGASDGGS